MKMFGKYMADFDYDSMVNDIKIKLSSKLSMKGNDKRNFYFFSVNEKEICITFNEGDAGFMVIFKNGEPVCCGYPQYSKIGAPWGGLGFILLSKKDSEEISEAFGGSNRIRSYVEYVIKNDYMTRKNHS